ncbi:MAG: ComEC/Rec2 family competence protein [Bacillota bacterium]|nr:ComEC/Rec2 family competence protein [Bacillota bacterium]
MKTADTKTPPPILSLHLRWIHLTALGGLAALVLERPRLFLPLSCLLLLAGLGIRLHWLRRGANPGPAELLGFWLLPLLGLLSIGLQIVVPQYVAARTASSAAGTHRLQILSVSASGTMNAKARLLDRGPVPQVALRLPAGTAVRPGDIVELHGRLERPGPPQNPGAFRQRRQLYLDGCFLQIQAKSVLAIDRPPPTALQELQSLLPRLRERLGRRFRLALGSGRGSLAAAMLTGDTEGLDPAIKEDFRRANLSHLLVVSGSNLATILFLVMSLLRSGSLSSRVRRLIGALVLFLFAALSGFDASVSRALVCALLALLARLLERPSRPLDRLVLAALLTLLLRPLLVLKTGYLMSLAASAAIVGLAPLLKRKAEAVFAEIRDHLKLRLALRRRAIGRPPIPSVREERRLVRYVKKSCHSALDALFITLSAQFALLPFLISFGQAIGSAGLLANLLAMPLATLLTALLLPVALLPLEAFPILARLAAPLYSGTAWLLDALVSLARRTAAAGLPEITLLPRDLLFIGAACLFLIALSLRKPRPGPARLVLGMAVVFLLIPAVRHLTAPDLRVYFYAVGQGDATLLDCRGGPCILIDTGTQGAGMSILPRALAAAGRRRIDLLVLTHWDQDHSGAARSLIESGLVHGVVWPPEDGQAQTAERLQVREAAARAGVKDCIWPQTGLATGAVHVHSLVPVRQGESGSNAHSRACLIEVHGWKLLLLADLEAAQERRLVTEHGIGRVDVVHVAHHGSATSSDRLLVARTRPRCAVISVGPNSYGHPAPAVLESWLDAGSRVLRTDRDGCIIMDVRARAFRVRTLREVGYGEIPETD